jgi:hypothetical protein
LPFFFALPLVAEAFGGVKLATLRRIVNRFESELQKPKVGRGCRGRQQRLLYESDVVFLRDKIVRPLYRKEKLADRLIKATKVATTTRSAEQIAKPAELPDLVKGVDASWRDRLDGPEGESAPQVEATPPR